jgi:2-desacetyl-2-hydroxyethyl bacteriochlorophyllide A dehydrogenase
MKAARFRGVGIIELVELPKPRPGEGEILIRVAANGLCGSDHKILERGFEHIPGHETVGTVVETGPGCTIDTGTRIAVYIPLYCGSCRFCTQGTENLCPRKQGLLGWATDGGYAEYMVLPERNALTLADGISFAQGVLLLDTLGTSGHALRLSRCWNAASVLVIGAGPIGIGAVAMLQAYGVPRIYVSEPSEYRRRKASELGARTVDPGNGDLPALIHDQDPYGVDIVFEAAGTWPTIEQSLDLVRPGGTINLVGEYWGPIHLERPKGSWMINDVSVIRSFYFATSEFRENQQMILDRELHVASLASHTFGLADIKTAYELFGSGQALKVLVTP